MTRVARIEMPDGTPVWARISGAGELAVPSGELSYTDTGFADRVEAQVESLQAVVTSVARSLAEPLRAVRPDEVSVEFGIELTAKAGKVVGLLADGEAKAGIKVTLTWNGGPPDPDASPTGSPGHSSPDHASSASGVSGAGSSGGASSASGSSGTGLPGAAPSASGSAVPGLSVSGSAVADPSASGSAVPGLPASGSAGPGPAAPGAAAQGGWPGAGRAGASPGASVHGGAGATSLGSGA